MPEGSEDPRWTGWTPFTYPFNLTQQPAATVPCGFTAAGLPAGLQIVGRATPTRWCCGRARSYEQAHPQPTVAARQPLQPLTVNDLVSVAFELLPA